MKISAKEAIEEILEDKGVIPNYLSMDKDGGLWVWDKRPIANCDRWVCRKNSRGMRINHVEINEFEGKDWKDCCIEYPITQGKEENLESGVKEENFSKCKVQEYLELGYNLVYVPSITPEKLLESYKETVFMLVDDYEELEDNLVKVEVELDLSQKRHREDENIINDHVKRIRDLEKSINLYRENNVRSNKRMLELIAEKDNKIATLQIDIDMYEQGLQNKNSVINDQKQELESIYRDLNPSDSEIQKVWELMEKINDEAEIIDRKNADRFQMLHVNMFIGGSGSVTDGHGQEFDFDNLDEVITILDEFLAIVLHKQKDEA